MAMLVIGCLSCSALAAEPKQSGASSDKTPVSITTTKLRAKLYENNNGVNAAGRKYVYVSNKDIKGIKDPEKLKEILSPEVNEGEKIRKLTVAVDLHNKPLHVVVPKGGSFGIGAVQRDDSRAQQNIEISTTVVNVNLHVVGR